ncbi:YolD-like family protein [Paenibacillus chartarius]|uniref:YolD-like family protein n=1 Tax=Paenibacillus chartarius TaxID=747481 RepID=A0ABV6DKH4_9BACL
MRKKLEGNGLWESSRMRLPEHQARMIRENQLLGKRERPTLDPYKWEEINALLGEAYREGLTVTVRIFDPYEYRVVTGSIAKVDVLTRKLLVDGTWIALRDIVEVTLAN